MRGPRAVSLPRPMKTCFGRSLFCDACEALSFDAAGARLRCALATKPGEPAASTQASAKRRVARAFSRILFRIREQGFRGMAEVSGTSVAGCRAVVIMQYAGPLVTKQFP